MAAAAWPTCMRNEPPPTAVPSTQRGVMCRYSEICAGVAPAVAMPSTSSSVNPASARASRAASACNWIIERSGRMPISAVSEAPTIATLRLMRLASGMVGSSPTS